MMAGRSDGRTGRRMAAVMVLLSVCPTVLLSGQVSFHLAAGARYSSTLVHDSIVAPLDLRPALAPALLLTVREQLTRGWTADATLDVSPAALRRHEGGGLFDAGSFTAVAFTVGVGHRLGPLTGRVGIGGLKYAADASGVFRQGSGGLFPLGTAAAAYAPTFGTRRHLEVEARYDVHRFITTALRAQGFVDSRPVHRVALLVRIGWGGAGSP